MPTLGRLFWKFFFFIWLTQMVLFVGVGAIFWLERQQESAMRRLDGGPRTQTLLAAAGGVYAHGGEAALRDLLQTPWFGGLLAVDEAGQDILGRVVPMPLLTLARETASSELRGVADAQASAPARWLRTSDGRQRLFFMAPGEHEHGELVKGAGPGHGGPPGLDEPPPGGGMGPGDHGRRGLPWEPLLLGTLVSLLSAAVLAWYFSTPIRELRVACQSLADGNLETVPGPTVLQRNDELADLAGDFARMVARLRQLMDGQRRLLHDVSHELRSPLARLQVAIGLLRQQPERWDESLQRIEREGGRIERLVGELLTLSRLEAGVSIPFDEIFQVEDLLAEIVENAGFEAEANGRRLDYQTHGDACLRGNAELLYRAIENVVRNALKYSPPGSTVTLICRPENATQELVLVILDEGPGVAEAELTAIFAPFYRASARREGELARQDGHGLGLALAARVVLAHGGRIAAANRLPQGLCVEIRLPVSNPVA